MDKFHKIYGMILLGVLVNLLIPFLGLYMVSDRSSIKNLSLIGVAISAFLLIAFDHNDLVFYSIYINGSSNIAFFFLFWGAVASSFLVYKDRLDLNIRLNSIYLVVFVLISWQLAHQAYAPSSKTVAANSLSPYLKAGSVVVFGKSPSEGNPELKVVKNLEDGSYSIGFLLASSGDSIGSADGNPIICKHNLEAPSCFEVNDVCAYLSLKAKNVKTNTELSEVLPENGIILATFLTIPDLDALKRMQRDAEGVYNVYKVFDTSNAFSFSMKPMSLDCNRV